MSSNINNYSNNNFYNLKSPKNQLSKLNNANLNHIGNFQVKSNNSSSTTKNSNNPSSKGSKEPLQEVILGIKNSLLASISGVIPNKLEEKQGIKKSQSPMRKDNLRPGSKNVKSF